MIKFYGWRVLPGRIILTEDEYQYFKRRYDDLADITKAEIEQVDLHSEAKGG